MAEESESACCLLGAYSFHCEYRVENSVKLKSN